MSKVTAATPKADPLREQLDELDQLMERMLSLGVRQPSKEPYHKPAATPPERPPEPMSAPESVSFVAIEPEMAEEGPEEASAYSHQANAEAELAASESEVTESVMFDELLGAARQDVAVEPEIQSPALFNEPEIEQIADLAVPGPTFVALDLPPITTTTASIFAEFQFAPPPGEVALEAMEAPAPEPVPVVKEAVEPLVFVAWWLRPLAVTTGIYDCFTSWMGPIGRGLRSRPVKNVLGLCGLAALLGAAAWMVWENTDWNS
ncbi:hypothetical protein BH10PLA2_BH10PLA2_21250 [soil metagenome]